MSAPAMRGLAKQNEAISWVASVADLAAYDALPDEVRLLVSRIFGEAPTESMTALADAYTEGWEDALMEAEAEVVPGRLPRREEIERRLREKAT